MSRSFVLLFFFVFSCGSIFADVDPRQGNFVNPSKGIFSPTGSMYLSADGWQRCPAQVEGESNPFEEATALTNSVCATSIDTFIEELTSETGVGSNAAGVKERFCERFASELVEGQDGEAGSCPLFNPTDEEVEEFKNECARNLSYIQSRADINYRQSVERNRESHIDRITSQIEKYNDLAEKQNQLYGELWSTQDGAVAVSGLTCLPEKRTDVFKCENNSRFNSYIQRDEQGRCPLGDYELCNFFTLDQSDEEKKIIRDTQAEMARLVVPDYALQELPDLLDNNRSVGEAFNRFKQHNISKSVEIDFGISRENNTEVYATNVTLLVNSIGSPENMATLTNNLQNPESEERQACGADPCVDIRTYLLNTMTFSEEISLEDREEKVDKIMGMMSALELHKDDFRSRYEALQLFDRARKSSNGIDVTPEELESAGLLRHGHLQGLVDASENITTLSEAFNNTVSTFRGNDPNKTTFQIFKDFITMERSKSREACNSFKTEVNAICQSVAANEMTLPPEETDQCLDFTFDSTYKNHLERIWQANNLSQDQMNGSYYTLVGMACIVAQESFSDNDTTAVANYRRRLQGVSPEEGLSEDAAEAAKENSLIESVRKNLLSDDESNAQGFIDHSLLPDMDEDPFGGATIRRSLRGDLANGGTAGGKLNSSDRRNGVGAAFAGLAKGNPDGVINGGVAGINGGVAGVNGGVTTTETRRNIEDSIDPSDPALAPYLQRIEELKASLAALESRLPAGEAGAQGEVAPSADMLALQAEIERERAELARLRADLEGQLANRNNGGSADPQGVDVNVATSFQGAGTTDPIAPPVDEAVEEADVAESYSSGITAPYGGGGGSGRSPASGGYDSALFLTETSDLLERYGAPIEVPYAEMQGRIMQTVNLDLLEEGEPVFKDLGNNQFLRYTLLENGEIEIKNVILPEGENPDLNDPVAVEEEVDDNPKTRYRRFKDL